MASRDPQDQTDSVALDEPYVSALEALSADIPLLAPCATPERSAQETIMTIPALKKLGKKLTGWKPAMAEYIAATFALMPEPPRATDDRPLPKRWCCKGYRRIAKQANRANSSADAMLKAIEDAGLMVVMRPGDSGWPKSAGDQGAMRAPVWGVFLDAAKQIGLQFGLITHVDEDRTGDRCTSAAEKIKSAPAAGALRAGGVGGVRAQRQKMLEFERAEQRHNEIIEHVATTGDDVMDEMRRLIDALQQTMVGCFSSLRDLLEPHLHHGHSNSADGIQKKGENEDEPCINFSRKITLADLNELWTVEEFFGIAVGQKPNKWQDTELDRITFFGLAIAARTRPNPGAWFNRAVSNKWWSFAEKIDIQNQARAAVKKVLHEDFQSVSQSPEV